MKWWTWAIIGVFIVAAVAGVVHFNVFGTRQSVLGTGNVYCSDYEFTCCVPTATSGNVALSATSDWQCPANAISCQISSYAPSTTYIYYSSTTPAVVSTIQNLFVPIYQANDQVVKLSPSTPYTVPKGAFVWADRSTQISYSINGEKLTFCGRAGCTQGVDISSDNCAYTVSTGAIYTQSGQNVGVSYTVPVGQCVLSWQQGDQHVCGNVNDVCQTNADCGGHTYNGNQECYARTLQTYGCIAPTLPSTISKTSSGTYYSTAQDPFNNANIQVQGNTCGVTSTRTVQCCGDADCGSGAVCDKSTWTCKAPAQVQCTSDQQCGVSQQCNIATKQLVQPKCVSGTCQQQAVQNVGCCSSSDCPSGDFCNANYQCEQSNPNINVACPFQCCVGQQGYFDKACQTGQYCVGNSCVSNPQCTTDAQCNVNQQCQSGQCVAKNVTCTAQFGGLIPTTGLQSTQHCDSFWCSVGLAKPAVTTGCGYDYSVFSVIAGIILVIIIGIFVVLSNGKKGGRRGRVVRGRPVKQWYERKGLWIAIGIIAAALLVIFYFAYIFWLIIVAVILVIAYFVLKHTVWQWLP